MLAVLNKEALFDHYWKILHAYAENALNREESIIEGVERLLSQRETLLAKYYDMKPIAQDISPSEAEPIHHSRLSHRLCNNCDISKTLESDDQHAAVQYNESRKDTILYGADIKFNGAPVEIFSGFSLSRLNSILNLHSDKCPGLSSPSFYVGSTHSSFVAHIEHASLWSIISFIMDTAKCGKFVIQFFVSLEHSVMNCL